MVRQANRYTSSSKGATLLAKGRVRCQTMNRMDKLPAFPEGWYFVAAHDSILREKLIEKTWLGQDIVAWCGGEGGVCVADAICPHLGSYLGPEGGGRVCNGHLVFRFTGSSSTPRADALPLWPHVNFRLPRRQDADRFQGPSRE